MKDIIFWKYERASPQWDVLCVLCLIFIFLTPKSWFDKGETPAATRSARLIVKADGFPTEKSAMEKRIREISGDNTAEISDWRERKDASGETFYEINIR